MFSFSKVPLNLLWTYSDFSFLLMQTSECPRRTISCARRTIHRRENVGFGKEDGRRHQDLFKRLCKHCCCAHARQTDLPYRRQDTYSKKKLLAKVFQGPMWDTKLVAFAGTFTKRRTEFEFALSVHTALGVDQLNSKVSSVMDTTQLMNQKFVTIFFVYSNLPHCSCCEDTQ